MNPVPRRDRVLLVGLAATLIVVFARPIRYLLDLAYQVEQSSGLALIPGLLILTVVFLFHQQSKRQEVRAQVATAEAEAKQAEARVVEMERLVMFGQSLGRSLDLDAIRDVVSQHLPRLTDSEGAWAMARFDRQWESLTPVPRRDGDATEWTRQELAERVVAQASVSRGADPVMIDGHLCTPMTAAGQIVGLLAVPESVAPMTEGGRRVLVAASTLLGISLRNAELFREVREHSLRDGLTGCYNRMHALEVIGSELRRARRTHAPLSLIMFDLDHFKAINDRFGHLTGDAVLMAVGSRMREVLRGSDLKCRFGGEEFLVLLPETPLEGARRVADNLRRELAELQVRWNNQTLAVTASFGVTTALPAEVDVEEFIGRADRALYKAKDQGRNCVHIGVATAVA